MHECLESCRLVSLYPYRYFLLISCLLILFSLARCCFLFCCSVLFGIERISNESFAHLSEATLALSTIWALLQQLIITIWRRCSIHLMLKSVARVGLEDVEIWLRTEASLHCTTFLPSNLRSLTLLPSFVYQLLAWEHGVFHGDKYSARVTEQQWLSPAEFSDPTKDDHLLGYSRKMITYGIGPLLPFEHMAT